MPTRKFWLRLRMTFVVTGIICLTSMIVTDQYGEPEVWEFVPVQSN